MIFNTGFSAKGKGVEPSSLTFVRLLPIGEPNGSPSGGLIRFRGFAPVTPSLATIQYPQGENDLFPLIIPFLGSCLTNKNG